jgi:hypothetical protein
VSVWQNDTINNTQDVIGIITENKCGLRVISTNYHPIKMKKRLALLGTLLNGSL